MTSDPSGTDRTQEPSGTDRTQEPSGTDRTQEASGPGRTEQAPAAGHRTEQPFAGWQPPGTQPPYRQLRRPTTDRMIAGVASGLGRYCNVDPTLVRVIFAAVVVLTGGLALLAYPIMWFVMPEEPAGAPAWPHPAPGNPPSQPAAS